MASLQLKKSTLLQTLVALAAAAAFMVNGGVRGWSSSSIPELLETHQINPEDVSLVTGLPAVGSFLGALVSGPLLQLLGRRRTLLLAALPWSASFVLLGFAPNLYAIFAARLLMGIMVGISSPAAQLYIAECSEPAIRGTLGSLTAALMAAGILFTFITGAFVNFDKLAFIVSILPILSFVAMFFCPESPSWLLTKNRIKEARLSIKILRGLDSIHSQIIDEEVARIEDTIEKGKHVDGNSTIDLCRSMLKRENFRPFVISLGLMFFQQFCGMYAIVFYAGTIFKASGSQLDRNYSAIIVGIVLFVFTLMSTAAADRLGRRVLLLSSSLVMFISLVPLGIYFYLKNMDYSDLEKIHWVPLASIILFMVGHSIGYNTLPFLVMSEIFPLRFRNLFSAMSTSFNLFCLFVVIYYYSSMVRIIGEYGVFWLYASCCSISIPFVYFLLPETKGKSLDEIEDMFSEDAECEIMSKPVDIVGSNKCPEGVPMLTNVLSTEK